MEECGEVPELRPAETGGKLIRENDSEYRNAGGESGMLPTGAVESPALEGGGDEHKGTSDRGVGLRSLKVPAVSFHEGLYGLRLCGCCTWPEGTILYDL